MALDPLVKAGIVLGLGFGGFADGIVLHQILGWHHLVCTTETCQPTSVEHLQRQNVQDGFFHLAVWLVSLYGTALLFRAARTSTVWSARTLAGAMLVGWGLFNFVEGVIDHHVLGLHHVRPGHPFQLAWDLAFLATGPIMGGIGLTLMAPRRGHRAVARPAAH
ncbi:MAG TPA: DUF2243 domain-containing protein [Planctomycetota bacterium]|nr:DUF2243 domain-containing protein [Planctomycetota bacterium]